MIVGVTVLRWWFEEMGTVFFILGIILIILLRKGEKEGIEIFAKGAGDFVSIVLIVGLARGINITLEEGLIEDTILFGLSNLVEGISKIGFAILLFVIYILIKLIFCNLIEVNTLLCTFVTIYLLVLLYIIIWLITSTVITIVITINNILFSFIVWTNFYTLEIL